VIPSRFVLTTGRPAAMASICAMPKAALIPAVLLAASSRTTRTTLTFLCPHRCILPTNTMRCLSPESTAARRTASRPKERLLASVSFVARVLSSVPFWWGLCLGCAGILALSARHSMNPDGLSYLELASEATRTGPSGLVNALWSPGYPALLSLALALFHPTPGQEFPLVHFVNFFIFFLTLWAFHFFLRQWLSYADTLGPTSHHERRDIVPFAFATFLWFTLRFVGLALVIPDLCMAASVFLIAGIICRLSLPGSSRKHYVALGFACGLGYYAKSPMFLLGLILFGGLLLYPPSRRVSRRRLLLSLSIFLLMAAPLVTLLSKRVGHLSFGEAGRLNYAWFVNGLQPWAGWTGSDLGQPFSTIPVYGLLPKTSTANSPHLYGRPEHPPRRLRESPLILEFSSPILGTFPLWYDPSYWYAGAKVRFDLHQQVAALKVTLRTYEQIFFQMAPFLAGAIVLCILTAREAGFSDFLRASWLVIWPLAAMLMYAFVDVQGRFVAVFCVLLWVAIYGALMVRVNRQVATAVCVTVAGAMMIPFALQMAEVSAHTVKDLVRSTPPDYETVAVGLRNLGVQSGDRLAVVGYPFDPYYAHYARLRVVAAIPATDEFWNLSPLQLKSVAECLTRIGVKAVVAVNRPAIPAAANWRDVNVPDSVRFSVLLLSEPLSSDVPPGLPGSKFP
jgi:hypothetical protein